jgi:shikimate dehydrogenase
MLETVAEAAPEALLSQSVNTVSVDPDGRLKGHSTDGYGLIAALDEAFGLGPAGLRTVLVGAGGAARACAVALVSAGAARLVIANRTQARGQALRDLLTPLGVSRGTEIEAVGLQELAVALAKGDVDVLVQATSLGLRADDPAPFPPALLPPGLPVMDMIYRETALLAGARNQGCPCADGRAMLLHQGARSFEIWFGFPPPLDAMRSGLEQALRAGTPS